MLPIIGLTPHTVWPSNACTSFCPCIVISCFILFGRLVSTVMGMSMPCTLTLPVNFIEFSVLSLASPPRAARFFATSSSTDGVCAAAYPAMT